MRKIILAPLVLGLATLTGCATMDDGYYGSTYGSSYGSGVNDGYYSGNSYNNSQMYGRVTSVRNVQLSRNHNDGGVGVGAVAGAIIGGLVGHQIGSGSGNTAATIGGAVAGGFIGDRIQDNNRRGSTWGQEIQVRLDNGQYVTIVQPGTSVYDGARVYVSGYGSKARVSIVR